MSRADYSDDFDGEELALWRGAVNSAINGKRGQAFLKEMLAALDALPEPNLIADALIQDGAVCAIGAVGKMRGVDMTKIDPEDYVTVANTFGIACALAREIAYMNDDAYLHATPEERFQKMRAWVVAEIKDRT